MAIYTATNVYIVCSIEILLSYLWRSIQICSNRENVTFSMNEYQNLMIGEGSVLRNILREGRKFKINLLLATQTLSVFLKIRCLF